MSEPRGSHLLGRFGGLGLLLHGFFHADGVNHQLQVGQNFGLVAADVALDRGVGERLGEVALDHHQVEQVGAVGAFSLQVLLLHLAHLFFQLFDLLDGCDLVFTLCGLDIGGLFGRCFLEQRLGIRHGDGVTGVHQLHRLHLAGGLHVALDASHVRGELIVLQQGDGLGADAFERVGAPVDGAQVDVECPGKPLALQFNTRPYWGKEQKIPTDKSRDFAYGGESETLTQVRK